RTCRDGPPPVVTATQPAATARAAARTPRPNTDPRPFMVSPFRDWLPRSGPLHFRGCCAACPAPVHCYRTRPAAGRRDMGEGLVPLLRLVGVTLGFPLVACLFGWSVLGRLTRLDAEERFAASWGVGFAILALGQFLAFLLRAPQPWFNLSTLGLMLLIALLCRGRKEPQAAAAAPGLWLLVACSPPAYLPLVSLPPLLPASPPRPRYF